MHGLPAPARHRLLPAERRSSWLHGSNTIGAQLGPALAVAYLKQLGANDTKTVPGAADEVTVQGTVSGSNQAIEISAHGSATAFADLAAGKCDIGMASRKIKPDETANLSGLGDMTSPASEHVLGLDGVAVIVNRASPVSALSTAQLAGIFSGETGGWKVYARDDKSGTYDTFKSLVLGSRALTSSAVRLEDSRQLAEKVASAPVPSASSVCLMWTGPKPWPSRKRAHIR